MKKLNMACLGVLFALDEKVVLKLKSFKSDADRLAFLQEEIEETIMQNESEQFAELDKSWEGLHRSLTDGKFAWDNGIFPLNHVIMGGEQIYNEDDYIMSLKTPNQVAEIAEAVGKISKENLRNGYHKISTDDEGYAEFLSNEDFEYTWTWFENSVELWKRAASDKRFVLFTADQ